MRLIDASELSIVLRNYFKEKLEKNEMEVDTVECNADIQRLLDNQPTAYDVEKVCAKIKRRSSNGYRDIDGDYVPPMIETEDAIEIIRKGGVNERD